MNTTSHPPMLQLDKVQVNDVAFKYQIDTDAENLLKLKYDQNTISFQFKVLDYINPSANYIQYKLENFDANWIFADNNSKIRFANLPYGDYVLLVKGFNSDNIETETIFKLNISIATPWWRSWLFYFLIVLVSSAIVLATIAYRIKSLKKNYEVRLKISQDLHDEVGATLSGIAMYSHLAKNQIQTLDLESVNNSLNVINESSNDIVSKLNDIVWLINPEKDTLKQLISRLEDYAIKMAATKEMQVLISLPDKILERTLQADTKRNIFLFCKEAINNVIKHSGATVFNFTVVQEKGILSFILADNGVGLDIDNTKNGNGMENMRTRARQMNATLQVNSTIGKGTTLNLILKSPNRG